MVTFVSLSGGVGLSVTCALTALELKACGRRCALVDADFDGGGLDILLGIENDSGLRFSGLNAPLGRIDGEALCRQLPHWEGMPVLSYDGRNGGAPQWWEVSAALKALAGQVDVVIIDASRGRVFENVPELAASLRVVVAELSVLGLARARSLLASRIGGGTGACAWQGGLGEGNSGAGRFAAVEVVDGDDVDAFGREGALAVVGIKPRGISRNRGAVGIDEARTYLGCEVLGPVTPDSKAASDVLEGLGVNLSSKGCKSVFARLARLIDDAQ